MPDMRAAAWRGNRRAHELLRLVDQDDEPGHQQLLARLTDRLDVAAVALCLNSVQRFVALPLSPDDRAAAAREQRRLGQLDRQLPDLQRAHRWLQATARHTVQLYRQHDRDRERRLRYYRAAALQSFQAEDTTPAPAPTCGGR